MENLIANLLLEIEKLHKKAELSKTVTPDYFEPGMMEHLDKYEGIYNEANGEILMRFEAKGTRYEGRTELIEKVNAEEPVTVERDNLNPYNPNNFMLLTAKNHNVGTMPAELCNAVAPLYDSGLLVFESAKVSYAEPISKRSRYAKQAILFVELKCRLLPCP